jgi:hypothetical protein
MIAIVVWLKREHESNWRSNFSYNLHKQTCDNNKSPTIVFIVVDNTSFLNIDYSRSIWFANDSKKKYYDRKSRGMKARKFFRNFYQGQGNMLNAVKNGANIMTRAIMWQTLCCSTAWMSFYHMSPHSSHISWQNCCPSSFSCKVCVAEPSSFSCKVCAEFEHILEATVELTPDTFLIPATGPSYTSNKADTSS